MRCGRRRFLGQMGAAVGAAVGVGAGVSACQQASAPVIKDEDRRVQDGIKQAAASVRHCMADLQYPFFGEHQAGITTPSQRHCYFLVVDLDTHKPDAVRDMFRAWTDHAAQLTQGKNIADYGSNLHLPPIDTGDADSLGAYGLTLTFGVSAAFFDKLGLQHKKPAELLDLPHFPRDQIRRELSGGDICIQACSDDPQVAFHAVRQLVRQARGHISMCWSQSGFVSYDAADETPRNLFGFKDGTANGEVLAVPERHLWAGDGNPTWFVGGTYLVVRLVQMHLETWDRTSLKGQEDTFGRHRATGAAIAKLGEFDAFDVAEKDADGKLIIAENTHMGLARRTGLQMLRRSYSYSSGIDARTGQFNSGLLFISFQKSPEQFIKIQNALGNVDKMTEYTTHIGSGLFACFSGVAEGSYLGQALFES